MHKALNVIRDEHRSIAAVLHGMQHLVWQIRERKTKIDPRVFRAMLYYLDVFSERMHHPKEDKFLFEPLRRRGAGSGALIAELEREHAEGGASLLRVEQCLIRYEEGGDKEFPEFAQEVDRFADGYWDHMRKEEEHVFPLAEKLFTAADWAAIERAFGENADPLERDRDEKDFQKLFSRIVSLAPPPIGVGPAA
ncbi:MAG TPA: hemerythrin domain-containing protein [Burkholderiales bacterium]